MCLRSSCTLDGHPAKAVACFPRSSSGRLIPSPDGSSSDDDSTTAAKVSGIGRTSITRPQASTRWTVAQAFTMAVGWRWHVFGGGFKPSSSSSASSAAVGVDVGSASLSVTGGGSFWWAAAVPLAPVVVVVVVVFGLPTPFRCGHGTLPRGILL